MIISTILGMLVIFAGFFILYLIGYLTLKFLEYNYPDVSLDLNSGDIGSALLVGFLVIAIIAIIIFLILFGWVIGSEIIH